MIKQDPQAFETLVKAQYKLADASPIKRLRQKAWRRYLQLGLPTRKTEVFRYINLRSLLSFEMETGSPTSLCQNDFARYLLPKCHDSFLVFINGHFFSSLSNTASLPEKIAISSIDDAARSWGTFLSNHWMKAMKEETDPFAAINAALHGKGAFLYVPPGTVFEKPLQILSLVDNKNRIPLTSPRIQGFIGARAKVEIAVTHAILHPTPYALNHVTDFHIEEGASVFLNQKTFGENDSGWQLEATRAALKKDAVFHAAAATEGSLASRYDYAVRLWGENSEAQLSGLSLLKDKRQAHTNVHVIHHAPHCRSNQLFKNCLSNQSHSSFEGKITVEKRAQKTEAYQLSANLLLNEGTRAESKPNLEIFADDVKASHGATFGRLDEEQMFYLKTRGLTSEAAKQALISGFSEEILQKLTMLNHD